MSQQQEKKQESFNNNLILTASINPCVHVAGAYNFIQLATQMGYKCKFLGPATSFIKIIKNIKKYEPEIVGLSYRLSPKTLVSPLKKFIKKYRKLKNKPKRIFFAGTPEVINIIKELRFFDTYFVGGESKYDIISILKNQSNKTVERKNVNFDLIETIKWKKPFPILRAHFGLPSLRETVLGIEKIANAKVLDIISIAPDQNTQRNYFHPEDISEEYDGAGGVPLRCKEDFIKIHKARLRENYPLLRIYAGTRDFIELAKLYNETIKNAWAAIPIFWFNQMDSRGPLNLKNSIKQHLKTIKWHGKHNIPVEINDSHHWSLRDAPDAIAVADMYLCGIIAKNLGVKDFIAQYMFNTPPTLSFEMDLAKMLAKNELLQTLIDDSFNVIKQVRTGLASFPIDLDKAKGQLASATLIQLSIKPDIVHVVSFSEGKHTATAEDVIESCKIVDQVINKIYSSNINLVDERVLARKNELITQAKWIIKQIPRLAESTSESKNPWINPNILTRLVEYGIFDAPHLQNNKYARGEITTKIIDGACYSWDSLLKIKLNERERIEERFEKYSDYLLIKDKVNLKKSLKEMIQ